MAYQAITATSDDRLAVLGLVHHRRHRNRANPLVSAVIPARNEARNLPAVLARLPRDVHELIVVDGDSSDGTVEVAQSLWPQVRIVQQTGTGKGNALAAGLARATGDILVMLDADGSTDPAEIPRFVAALVAGADLVKGSRFAQGGGSADITFTRRVGNKVLCGLVNSIYGTSYTDLCYGYSAFWADCLPILQSPRPLFSVALDEESPFGRGFEVETVINVRAAKAALRVWEVPSFECRRIHGHSNLNTVRDGLRVARKIWSESPAICSRYTGAMAAPDEAVRGLLPEPRREQRPPDHQRITEAADGSIPAASKARTATIATNGGGANGSVRSDAVDSTVGELGRSG
jgi:glycosyltransferase involved in cell wall biosynthesis